MVLEANNNENINGTENINNIDNIDNSNIFEEFDDNS
jgi:hypothetical protein